jgi:hypothetical protein
VRIGEGDNFRIDLEDGRACCTVWRRRDLSSDAGARCAEEKIAYFQELAARPDVYAMLLDRRAAPPFTGPRTQRSLAIAFSAFEQHRKPLAVLSANRVRAFQLLRVIASSAPMYGRDFYDYDTAIKWLASFRSR